MIIAIFFLLTLCLGSAFLAVLVCARHEKVILRYQSLFEVQGREIAGMKRELDILFEKNNFFDKKNKDYDRGFEIVDQNFASINNSINGIIREVKSLCSEETALQDSTEEKSKLN